jgi:RNA polymerase sigma-70 factor (ECF subfamily)
VGSEEERRARFENAALPFMDRVHRVALRLTRRPEDARDLLQETYLRAFRAFDSFTPGTNCKAWLFKIQYSIFVNRYRKEKREPAFVPFEDMFHRVLDDPAALERMLGESRGRGSAPEVTLALESLPESFRSAVLLVDVEELSYEEAAAALGCPIGTLRSRLFRARRMLFTALSEYAKTVGHVRSTQVTE